MLDHPRFGGEPDSLRSGRSRASGTATGCWSRPTTARCGCDRAAAATSPRSIPQLHSLADDLGDHHVVLDGEVVALDAPGVPSFAEMQNRARATRIEFWAFDLLYLDGRSLLRASYRDRRQLLETLRRRRRSDRSGPAARRRCRGAGLLAQARVGGRDRQEARLHLSAGPPLGVLGQGQVLEHPGSGHRRLARRRRRAHQRHRLAADGHSRRRRTAFRRSGRHRVHRTRPGQR